MALTICPACGKQVSTSTTVCPHCGANIASQSVKSQTVFQQPVHNSVHVSNERKVGVWGILALVFTALMTLLSAINQVLSIIAWKHYNSYTYNNSFAFHYNEFLSNMYIFPILSIFALACFVISYILKENEKLRMITACLSIGDTCIFCLIIIISRLV